MPVVTRDVEINGFSNVVEGPVKFPEAGQYEVTIIAPTPNDYEVDGDGNKMLYGMSSNLTAGGTFVDADGQYATATRDYSVDERSVVGIFVLTVSADEEFLLSVSENISGSGIVAYVTKKMSPMVLRSDKGSVLTHDEMDNNFKIAKEVEAQKKLAVDLYVSNVGIKERLTQLETNAIKPYYSSSTCYMGVDSNGNVGWGNIVGSGSEIHFNVLDSTGEVIDASELNNGGIIVSAPTSTGIGFQVLAVSDDGSGNLALDTSNASLSSGFTSLLGDIPRFGSTLGNQILASVRDQSFNSLVGQQFGWNFYTTLSSYLYVIFGGASKACPVPGCTLASVEKSLSDGTTVNVNRWCTPVIVSGDTEDTIEYVEYQPSW